VALSTELPVILYDVPGRTGVAIADVTVARLFDAGLIVGLKDATGDLARPGRLQALCGAGLVQLSGDDGTAAAYRAMGGDGCISVTGNLVPGLCARMHGAWDRGDIAGFARLRDMLAPLHEALFVESNPIPIKAALGLAGLCEAEVRLPLTAAAETTTARLEALLPALLEAEEARPVQPRLRLVR
jgi:4-hydroxy-tetrahydrodipicolinate synthase